MPEILSETMCDFMMELLDEEMDMRIAAYSSEIDELKRKISGIRASRQMLIDVKNHS